MTELDREGRAVLVGKFLRMTTHQPLSEPRCPPEANRSRVASSGTNASP
ncbi:hypothetical protein F0344_05810 [Streptomyces finlayi]|uniref:Uncharacterized protein n=1 Tax=Streptomyces finlayi TaxID=67296 RepID=A0A7G7BFS2_9ACTN|nr:hypothetical protein [Streptomyces finlayi]QNE74187.1 hypothetical protein F0344_05810 [Streptomyces finlayi]